MSCLCQYYNTTREPSQQLVAYPLAGEEEPNENEDQVNKNPSTDSKGSPDAGQLADTYAENWLLKKKLLDYEVAIENLEQLVTTVVDKQHDILGEMFRLRAENRELKTECNQQREFHAMERNALIKELHDIQILYTKNSRQLALKEKQESLKESESDCEYEDDDDDEDDVDDDDDDDDRPSRYTKDSESYDNDISGDSSTSPNTSPSATESEIEYAETEADDDDDDDDESKTYDTDSESD